MDIALNILLLVAQGGIILFLFALLVEARRVRCLLDARYAGKVCRVRVTATHHAGSGSSAYAIWTWRDEHWELELGTVPLGHEAGDPPIFPGSFAGQRVKTQCFLM